MRVLVTGGSSLLGRMVADLLVERGDRVTCFQRSPSGSHGVDVLGDIRDREAVVRAAGGHDAVVHLAALVAPRPAWADAFAVNVVGTRNVFEAAARCGRLLHVSSPSVAFDDTPSVGVVAGRADYDGSDAYTRTKAIAERLVLDNTSTPTVVIRPHLVWGPGDTQLIGRIVDRARQGRLALPDNGRALVDTGARAGLGGHRERPPAARRAGRGHPWRRRARPPGPLRASPFGRPDRSGTRPVVAGRRTAPDPLCRPATFRGPLVRPVRDAAGAPVVASRGRG
jgi:uncharacterized protein YbjT (DUF2867 family)